MKEVDGRPYLPYGKEYLNGGGGHMAPTESLEDFIKRSEELILRADLKSPSKTHGLTAGRWDADKNEWTTDSDISVDVVSSESGLTAGKWDPVKKKWFN